MKRWLTDQLLSTFSNLKTIGTDLENVIFNGFLFQVKDLKLLLCVFYLQQVNGTQTQWW